MLNARRGEVWLVDLGMAAKARPAAILSIPFWTMKGLSMPSYRTPRPREAGGLRW